MTDEITLKFECGKCGPTILEVSEPRTDESTVMCKTCGSAFGSWAELQAKAKKVAGDKIRADFKNAFKGLKGWKIS